MATVARQILDLSFEPSEELDELFFAQTQMARDKLMRKFAEDVEETKKDAFSQLSCKGVMGSVAVKRKEKDALYLENEVVLASEKLAEVFARSSEIASFVVVVHGFDELNQSYGDEMLKQLFADTWSSVISEAAYFHIWEQIQKKAQEENLYVTCPWCPGQPGISTDLQKALFACIKPEEIGVELRDGGLMFPMKALSGLCGIGPNADVNVVKFCDVCHIETLCSWSELSA